MYSVIWSVRKLLKKELGPLEVGRYRCSRYSLEVVFRSQPDPATLMACVDSEWERACWTIWDELHPLRAHAILLWDPANTDIYQTKGMCFLFHGKVDIWDATETEAQNLVRAEHPWGFLGLSGPCGNAETLRGCLMPRSSSICGNHCSREEWRGLSALGVKRVEGRSETTVRAVESVLAPESGSDVLGRQRGSSVERASQGHWG